MKKTDANRITLRLPADLTPRLDDYQFNSRIRTRTQALITALKRGLDELEKEMAGADKTPADPSKSLPA